MQYTMLSEKLPGNGVGESGVLQVRRGALKGVIPGENLRDSDQREYATWLSAVMGEDRVFTLG